MIYRGTTPTIKIHIQNDTFQVSELTDCCIAIENDSGRHLQLFTNCTLDDTDNTVSVKLTHDQTMEFEPGFLEVQFTATLNGDEMCSEILRTEIGDNKRLRG